MINWRSATLALAAMALTGLWWTATLRHHYKANATRLFTIGSDWKMPPEIESLAPAKVPGTGYAGQWYLLMAFDPFLEKHFNRFMDDGRLRYRRILLPVLTHLLSGDSASVPVTFIGVTLVFLGLGVYWCSQMAESLGRSYWWGTAFLLLPGSVVSVERMGVDGALAALTMGFCHYVREKSRWRLFFVLALAGLVRESGLLLIGAIAIACVCSRDWCKLIPAFAAALPALGWIWHVNSLTTAGKFAIEFEYPLSAVVRLFQHPEAYPASQQFPQLVQLWDYASILAFLGVIALICWYFKPDPIGWAGALFAASAIYLASCKSQTTYYEVLNYARVFAPLFVIALVQALQRSSWLGLGLTGVISLRLGLFFVLPLYTLLKLLVP